jgi:hypothetical protein
VTVKGGKLAAGTVSPHCDSGTKHPTTESVPQEYMDVKFQCSTAPSKNLIATGVVGGGYEIPLYNSKGRLMNVTLAFNNDKEQGSQNDVFVDIVNSFKLN